MKLKDLQIEQEMQLKDYTDRTRNVVKGLHRKDNICSGRIIQIGQDMQFKDYTARTRNVVEGIYRQDKMLEDYTDRARDVV